MVTFAGDSSPLPHEAITLSSEDYHAPLGQKPPRRKRAGRVAGLLTRVVAGVLVVLVLGIGAFALLVDNPLGGEPVAVIPADMRFPEPEKKVASADAPAAAADAEKTPADSRTITIIDGMSGKRQQVVVAARDPAEADGKLLEKVRHGMIPKVAADGARPSEVFARPVKVADAGTPRIAIVITGLGIGSASTADAIAKLPAPVTFAFAPYGHDLERLVERARAANHEILLQVPMEPADYPDNDPGPQTLLTSLNAEQNVDRLHWFMSRIPGYVGLTNFMGAKFTASDTALTPVMREAGRRGLIYVDDGSSARSHATQLSGANNVPFARADLTIDAAPTAAEIEAALKRLETMARERGSAVGIASALPITVERIAQWVKAAEARGIAIVPISMVATRPRSS